MAVTSHRRINLKGSVIISMSWYPAPILGLLKIWNYKKRNLNHCLINRDSLLRIKIINEDWNSEEISTVGIVCSSDKQSPLVSGKWWWPYTQKQCKIRAIEGVWCKEEKMEGKFHEWMFKTLTFTFFSPSMASFSACLSTKSIGICCSIFICKPS